MGQQYLVFLKRPYNSFDLMGNHLPIISGSFLIAIAVEVADFIGKTADVCKK